MARVEEVLAARGRQVCVLASGDPFHYGVGAVLARHVDPRRDGGGAGAVGLQPGGGAARLVAAGDRAAVAAWPRARSGPPASAARRAHARADLRRRRPGGARAAAGAERIRRVAAHRAGSARRAARAHPQRARRRIRSRRWSTRSTRSRSRSRRRPARGSSPLPPGCADASVRARRPDHQARDPRGHAVVAGAAARRAAVGHRRRLRLGCDRMDAGRSVAARDRDRARAPIAPRASAATPPRSACRASSRRTARRRQCLANCRRPMRSSSAAAPAIPACSMRRSRALRPGGRLVVNAVTLETEALLIARQACGLGGELLRHRDLARRAARRQDRLAAGACR